ncbi:MAG: hypothetical protein LRY72_16555 [Saccharospirillaceae bacterium]|nr:hypothetical protein [Saccharospirillaceae bacterium]
MNSFDSALIILSSALFFSLLLERLLEILKALFDFYEVRAGRQDDWNRAAHRLSQQLDGLRQAGRVQAEVSKAVKDYLRTDYPGLDGVEALSASALRSLTIKTVSNVLAIILGVLLALLLDINLFALIEQLNHQVAILNGDDPARYEGYFSSRYIPALLGECLTGIAIGLGSGPLHKIIEALEKSRKNRTDKGA